MLVARIAKSAYADLLGKGAEKNGARWNSPGRPVVYTASCGALAALEYLAHVQEDEAPPHLYLLHIDVPDALDVENCSYTPADPANFRKLGDEWLQRAEKPVMKVPSVLVPHQFNFLLNPTHPDCHLVKVVRRTPFAFDYRLLSTT